MEMDYTSWQIQQKLETLSQLVNDHAPHEAGQVNFRGEGEHGYDFTINYRNDQAGVRNLTKFLRALKETGIIKDNLPNIAYGKNNDYPINNNVSVNTEFNNAVIIFTYDNTTEHAHIIPALDKAIEAAMHKAQNNNNIITTSKEVEKRDIVTVPPDPAIDSRLKELVSLINYAQAAGNAQLSYKNGVFNIAFPNDKYGRSNKEKILAHMEIKHESIPGQSATSRPEVNIVEKKEEGRESINIVFTPSLTEDNIKFLDKAIENATRYKKNIFREPITPRTRQIISEYQEDIKDVSNYLLEKSKTILGIPENNISISYKLPKSEGMKPSFTITITENKLTPENSAKLLAHLKEAFRFKPDIFYDKEKSEHYILIDETPKALMGYIRNKNPHTARTR